MLGARVRLLDRSIERNDIQCCAKLFPGIQSLFQEAFLTGGCLLSKSSPDRLERAAEWILRVSLPSLRQGPLSCRLPFPAMASLAGQNSKKDNFKHDRKLYLEKEMKIKAAWIPWLHELKRKELLLIFSKCPDKVFNRALELGAGDGFQGSLLTKYASRMIISDKNPSISRHEPSEQVKYYICDAEEVDSLFSEQYFDLIFSSNALEHVLNPNRALKNIHKILNDNGIIIHIMPSPFWKFLNLLLHFPNFFISVIEKLTEKESSHSTKGDILPFQCNFESKGHTQEITSKYYRILEIWSYFYSILLPHPHGVSKNNFVEFYAFSKYKWTKEFAHAGFEIVKIINGPVMSPYGFGLDRLRQFLERLGFTSEYIYIATKSGKNSPYTQYF